MAAAGTKGFMAAWAALVLFGGSARAAAPDADLDQALAQMHGKAKQIQGNLNGNLLKELPETTCKENTIFVDWGSSGMKVFPVHKVKPGQHLQPLHEHKIKGVGPDVDDKQLLDILTTASSKLPKGHVGGAVLATAGFRQRPVSADKRWDAVRKWNEQNKLFVKCTTSEHTGCHTLEGVEEAEYETRGMLKSAKHRGKGKRVGMVSCGGASIQLGVWGAPHDLADRCVKDLGMLSKRYDSDRMQATNDGAFFSWLANHRAPVNRHSHSEGGQTHVQSTTDYQIGGVNDMRSRYDAWLAVHGDTTNPCVSPRADSLHKSGGICDELAGKGAKCLTDKWGGYMTRLKGTPGSDLHACNRSVDEFLASDLMLSRWQASKACKDLIRGTPSWGLLSSFSRSNQLGADVSEAVSWHEALASSKPEDAKNPFESAEDLRKGTVGEVLTSTLLMGVLRHVGLKGSAQLQASKGDVASMAMEDFGLAKGWVKDCPKVPGTLRLDSESSEGLRRTLVGAASRRTWLPWASLGLLGVIAAAAVSTMRRAPVAKGSCPVEGSDVEEQVLLVATQP